MQATVVSLQLTAAGDTSDFADGSSQLEALETSLAEQLSCSAPGCVLAVEVTPGSVLITATASIPEEGAGGESGSDIAAEVTAAANSLADQPVDQLSTSLGVEILDVPSAPTVANDVPVLIARPPDTGQTQEIEMNLGWTWISSPLFVGSSNDAFGDFSGLATSMQDVIKNQFLFTSYVPGYGWFGALTEASPFDCYKVKLSAAGTAQLTGTPTDPTGHEIDMNLGWTWVGWPSLNAGPVSALTDALEDPSKLNTLNERIKSQYKFTSYVPSFGWFGELTTFNPGQGYMIKLTQTNKLISFGAASGTGRQRALEAVPTVPQPARVVGSDTWSIKPDLYEFSMCIVGVVVVDGGVTEDGELAAFIGGQLRGIARPSSYEAPIGPYKGHRSYNLMVFGRKENDGAMVTFQHRHADGRISELSSSTPFSKDEFLGSIADPFVIALRSPSTTPSTAVDAH